MPEDVWAELKRATDDHKALLARIKGESTQPQPFKRPQLRLVVDNTTIGRAHGS